MAQTYLTRSPSFFFSQTTRAESGHREAMLSAAIDAGDATYLETIPEEFRGTDYCGNARTTDGKVGAGAVQAVAAASAGGKAGKRHYESD